MPDRTRFAWAKLNAYGIILAGLLLLGLSDLIDPGGANLARLVGEVPPGQHFWVTGFVISGLLLLWGFARQDRLAESMGLVVMFASVLAQTLVSLHLLGWAEFTLTRFIIVAILGLGGGARISALWSRDGLVVTIPPRGKWGQR